MNKELRTQAIELRVSKRMSYSAINKQLRVSKSTLSYWLSEYPLNEEEILTLRRKGWEKGEASRERYRNSMREKQQKNADTVYKKQMTQISKIPKESAYVAGLMLYAAEGAKKDKYRIILANTDAQIIKFFVFWLKEFLGIKKNKLRFQLHLYQNMDIKKELDYWSRSLGISKDQLYKPQVRTLQSHSFSYSSDAKNRHGTCSLQYSNRDHKLQLMMGIKAFLDLHTR
jgi:hypothetical protein